MRQSERHLALLASLYNLLVSTPASCMAALQVTGCIGCEMALSILLRKLSNMLITLSDLRILASLGVRHIDRQN
jgi:coenzyme F420-reducing hydrogenase gamma subunit